MSSIGIWRHVAMTVCAALMVAVGLPASAVPLAHGATEKLKIDGTTYGPESGLVVDHEQVEVSPGGPDVVRQFANGKPSVGPQATWDSSYAISTETVQLHYSGKAKAAANIYSGQRIVQVCIWYTRGGVVISSKVCSNATSSPGYWVAGPEARTSAWDSLDPGAPKTIFNITTARINPAIV